MGLWSKYGVNDSSGCLVPIDIEFTQICTNAFIKIGRLNTAFNTLMTYSLTAFVACPLEFHKKFYGKIYSALYTVTTSL